MDHAAVSPAVTLAEYVTHMMVTTSRWPPIYSVLLFETDYSSYLPLYVIVLDWRIGLLPGLYYIDVDDYSCIRDIKLSSPSRFAHLEFGPWKNAMMGSNWE